MKIFYSHSILGTRWWQILRFCRLEEARDLGTWILSVNLWKMHAWSMVGLGHNGIGFGVFAVVDDLGAFIETTFGFAFFSLVLSKNKPWDFETPEEQDNRFAEEDRKYGTVTLAD